MNKATSAFEAGSTKTRQICVPPTIPMVAERSQRQSPLQLILGNAMIVGEALCCLKRGSSFLMRVVIKRDSAKRRYAHAGRRQGKDGARFN
uniref:Uncharacterized protein n=1 Tax=Rhipicephalus zambeziensis TaxID=60191 RepID=A0A224YJZ3_9ACAR